MLIAKFKTLSSNQFIRNLSWVGGGEVVSRVFRLVTTVTLARVFTPHDYGAVSVIYTVYDITSALTLGGGIAAKIIQADEENLNQVCNTSYWLSWLICGALFVAQCLAAYPSALFFGNTELFLPLCVLGLCYLILPNYLVQAALSNRDNQLKVKSLGNVAQALVSSILVAILALLGWGVWAVVSAMVLSYFVWIRITHHYQSWRPSAFMLEGWREVLGFSGKSLSIDLLVRLRRNIDYLIVGRVLGLEALGTYFFAFNAGLGISLSVLNALTSVWYPHFCQVRTNLKQLRLRYLSSLKTIALIIVPLVVLQSTLAPFYVPIIFGQRWITAIPILILICISAIPVALSNSTSQLLLAVDKLNLDLYWNAIFTVIFAVSLILVAHLGVIWVAVTVLVTQALLVPIFTIWVVRNVFRNSSGSNVLL